jgi:hypothetical protein
MDPGHTSYWRSDPDLLGAFVQGATGTGAGLVPLAGLAERLSAGSHALWMCLLTATLFLQKGQEKGKERA